MEYITVDNKKFPVRKYNNISVITFSDIDKLHERPRHTSRNNFYNNKNKFIENKDYFKLTSKDDIAAINMSTRIGYPHGIMVFTESGYLMLVKSLTDEKSWRIQRILVDSYFKSRELPAESKDLPQSTSQSKDSMAAFEKLLNVQLKMIEMERENTAALREENAELREMVKDLINLAVRLPAEKPAAPKPVCEGNLSYTDFKKQINKGVEDIIAFHHPKYKDKNSILREAYERIRRDYGIVYEQEKKEFFEEMGRSATGTLELQWYIESVNPACRNLLISKLNSIYNEVKAA